MAACHSAWDGDMSGLGGEWALPAKELRSLKLEVRGVLRGQGSRIKSDWRFRCSLRGRGQGRNGSGYSRDWGWGSWWFYESGETYSLPTAPVVAQLEAGHFFDASITKQHLFASVHDAVLFALQHPRSSPASPVLVSWPLSC